MASIFEKQRVTHSSMRAVAQKRYDDAWYLAKSGINARANGAMYLAGFVIEILLKAQMLKTYSYLNTAARPDTPVDARRWDLVFRRHDLERLLAELPSVVSAVAKACEKAGKPYQAWLQAVCETWTIHARYSTASSSLVDVEEMLSRIRVLKEII